MTEPPHKLLDPDAQTAPPGRASRLLAVIRRHWIVYSSTFLANALPAFLEPLLFLTALGFGLGSYVADGVDGFPLGAFMGPGALAMTAMFTAAFETSYGAFVRLVYQKTYDGMLATPLSVSDVFLGEILWCGCKGVLFTSIVLAVFAIFGWAFADWTILFCWSALGIPLVGGVCSMLFGALGLHITSITKNMNNFNFFITGMLTPMSLFSGMVFPVADLPNGVRQIAYALPLFHVTELNRLLLFGADHCVDFVWVCPLYLLVVTPLLVASGLRVMRKRIVV